MTRNIRHAISFRLCTAMTILKKTLKWTVLLFAVSLLAGFGHFYYSLITGEERVTAICKQMAPGMPRDELIRLAKQNGLGPNMPSADAKRAYLVESYSFGRHGCRVELDGGVVKNASYNFAD